jgi:hypothetical protein
MGRAPAKPIIFSREKLMGFAEPVIGPATSGRTRWLCPSYALHFLYYNFARIHQTLKVSPAMAAGVTNRLWEMKDVVIMLDAWEATQRIAGSVLV